MSNDYLRLRYQQHLKEWLMALSKEERRALIINAALADGNLSPDGRKAVLEEIFAAVDAIENVGKQLEAVVRRIDKHWM